MKAMVLSSLLDLTKNSQPLEMIELLSPKPGPDEVLIKVSACGVCHTELDEIEGRTAPSFYPIILGHQVTGRIVELGADVKTVKVGDRIGVAWIFSSCGKCNYCNSGNENLCPEFRATGRDVHGGYAEYMVAKERFVHPIPLQFSDVEAAPLLCAGAIGYRSLRLAGIVSSQMGRGEEGKRGGGGERKGSFGLTGFGASAHLVLKMIKYLWPGSEIYVFARSEGEREFAMNLGATWAGDTFDEPPEKLDLIIDTTPVWKTVVEALKNLKPGGRLVINAIRKEIHDKDYLLNLDYAKHLWMEKEIKSVANVALSDVREFLQMAAKMNLKPEIQVYPLEEANRALMELKQQKIRGAKVLRI